MKKYILATLFVSIFASPALARQKAESTNETAIRLIKKAQNAKGRIKVSAETPILRFNPSPIGALQQGAQYSVFITPVNTYSDSNILLDATLDGNSAPLIHSAENLWIYHAAGFSELKTHTLSIQLSIENRALAKQLRTSIDRLTTEIFNLQKKIDAETDPVKKAALIAQQNEKIAIKNELIRQLAALKTPISSQDFAFEVVPAVNNPNFPRISGVSPQAGSAAGGTEITINGQNFVSGMTVKIGGVVSQASFVNGTTITAISPSFGASTGIKDIEIVFPPLAGSTEPRNSILRNAFFATNSSLSGNVKPVAQAGSHQIRQLGETVQLNGSGSYDPNEPLASLLYSWKVKAAPPGSNLTPEQPLDSVQNPQVQPSVAGFYVFELVVTENSTEQLVSEPSLTTVEVQGPVNHAPEPTAPAITTDENVVGTTTVAPGDVDQNQSL